MCTTPCRLPELREAQRTMLTEDSTNVVALIEAMNDEQTDRARQAVERLSELFGSVFWRGSGQAAGLDEESS